MNKLIKINPTDMRYGLAHPDKAFAVESVTAEGAPYTFATIFRNKHGRTNLSGIGCLRFMAGSNAHKAIEKYAKTVDPNTTAKYFIERGQFVPV
jgi:hypothetical protein